MSATSSMFTRNPARSMFDRSSRVTGIQSVLAEMQKRREALARGVSTGLRAGGLLIQRESKKQVPVEFNVLRGSSFIRRNGSGMETKVSTGYTAEYALYVHEAEMKHAGEKRKGWITAPDGSRVQHKGQYWDPQGRGKNKFLEDPVKENVGKVRMIVRTRAKASLMKAVGSTEGLQ